LPANFADPCGRDNIAAGPCNEASRSVTMTRGSLEHTLGLLLQVCADDDARANAPGPPASGDQKQGRVTEALLHSIDGTCELFRRMRERTAPRT